MGLVSIGRCCVQASVGSIASQCFRQVTRSCVFCCNSSNELVNCASAHMLSGRLNCRTATQTRRSLPSSIGSIHRIWQNHWCRLLRITVTRSCVRFVLLTSSFPVNRDRHLVFAPFSCVDVRSSMFHDSQTYVIMNVTAAI